MQIVSNNLLSIMFLLPIFFLSDEVIIISDDNQNKNLDVHTIEILFICIRNNYATFFQSLQLKSLFLFVYIVTDRYQFQCLGSSIKSIQSTWTWSLFTRNWRGWPISKLSFSLNSLLLSSSSFSSLFSLTKQRILHQKQVIYVKPGNEANLDSLVQDTIRLTTSIKVWTSSLTTIWLWIDDLSKQKIMNKCNISMLLLIMSLKLQDTCSELCEKSTFTMNCKCFLFIFLFI